MTPKRNQHQSPRILFSLILLMICIALPISPAHAKKKEKPPFPEVALSARMQGEQAIRALGDKLPEVSAWYGKTPTEFKNIIRQDRSAWLDNSGRLLFIEPFPEQIPMEEQSPAIESAPFPYDQTFKLHSRLGSSRVIYLDFNGYYTTERAWNNSYGEPIEATAFDLDGDPTSFSNDEKDKIQQIWQHIAEDYAPFDVDLTTEDPGQAAITRSSLSDENYGTRVVITSNFTTPSCQCGGFAYVGVYNYIDGNDYYKPAFVFYDMLGSNAKLIAEASTHEAGHNLGLSHDGTSSGPNYYSGHGGDITEPTSWAPIMGVGYYTSVSQWSKGEYLDANNNEDDLQLIQEHGAVIKADDHSNTQAGASSLNGVSDSVNVTLSEAHGIIEKSADIDFFEFNSGSGNLNISIQPAPLSPNLDILARLYDSNGDIVASFNPTDSLSATIVSHPVASGSYFISVEGTGKGNPNSTIPDGYTDYASIGQYSINGSMPDAGDLQSPVSVISATPTNGPSPLTVDFTGSASYDPDGNIVNYHWNFNDNSAASSGANTVYTFDEPGSYSVTLTVTDNDGLTNTATISITVENQLPVAVATANISSGEAPLPVDFTGSESNDADGTISSWVWSFGDGNNSIQANPSHIYSAAGDYTATLTVTDNLGASTADSVAITVTPDPTVNSLHVNTFAIALNTSSSAARGGKKGGGGETGTKSATVTITILDENGSALKNISVEGRWGGLASGVTISKANRRGKVEIISPATAITEGTFTFTILNVTRSGYNYIPNSGNETRSISLP